MLLYLLRYIRYLDVYTTQSPELKLMTAAAWLLLAFIILVIGLYAFFGVVIINKDSIIS